ncbi:hypothetical protein LCGC14_2361150 [marine sediment metagenome]|uniref:Uncharacterized protein n=1 Tax=marine sediment metagenome TaxID=412755 RepID=A0A0F9CTX2_9ZZZZ
MDNLKIGDKVGLSWIQGHGNAKVVGIYQNYYTVIHNCNDKPMLVYKSDLVPPENSIDTRTIVEQAIKSSANLIDVQNAKLYYNGTEIGIVRYIERQTKDVYLIHTTSMLNDMSSFLQPGKWEVYSDSSWGSIKWFGWITKWYPNNICMTPIGAKPVPSLEVTTIKIAVEDRKRDILPPEPTEPKIDMIGSSKEVLEGSPYNNKYKEIRQMIINDIQSNGPIREARKKYE